MRKLLLISFLSILLQAQEIAVVVAQSFDANKLTRTQIKRIFLAKTNKVNNKKIKIIELKDASYKKDFYKTVTGKSPSQLRSYWTRLIFSGKALPPKQMKSIDLLLTKMKKDKNTITYLPLSEVTKNMKVLYTMQCK